MSIPFLPAVIAAFTLANGANYWHQQLKPFKTSQEQTQAIKEELAESPFTAYWTEADKHELVENKKFIKFCGVVPLGTNHLAIKFNSWDNEKTRDNFFHKISKNQEINKVLQWAYVSPTPEQNQRMLSFGSTDILIAKNRCDIKKIIALNAMVLSHEGVHHAQFAKNPALNPGRAEEDDADTRGISALMNTNHLSWQEKRLTLNSRIKVYSDSCNDHHNVKKLKQMFETNRMDIPEELLPVLPYNLICESPVDPHAPCKERIENLKCQIPHIRMEIINDTIRDEIAWQ